MPSPLRRSYLDSESDVLRAGARQTSNEKKKMPAVLSRRDENPLMGKNHLYSGGISRIILPKTCSMSSLRHTVVLFEVDALFFEPEAHPSSATLACYITGDIGGPHRQRRSGRPNSATSRHGLTAGGAATLTIVLCCFIRIVALLPSQHSTSSTGGSMKEASTRSPLW